MKQHTIPQPPPITDEMTTAAVGIGPYWLLGETIVTVYELGSSNGVLLLCESGRVILVDAANTSEAPDDYFVGVYDATETASGPAIKALERGHWHA